MTEIITNLAAFTDKTKFKEIEGNRFYQVMAVQGVGQESNSLYKREDGQWIMVDFEKDPHAFEYKVGNVWESGDGEIVPNEFIQAWDLSQELNHPLYETVVFAYQQNDIAGILEEIKNHEDKTIPSKQDIGVARSTQEPLAKPNAKKVIPKPTPKKSGIDTVDKEQSDTGFKSTITNLSEFLEINYFLKYGKTYKVYECLIATLYMYYTNPQNREAKYALHKIELLIKQLPNFDKYYDENYDSLRHYEVPYFLTHINKGSIFSSSRYTPLSRFKLPEFDSSGVYLEVPGNSVLLQTYSQVRQELKDDLEYLRRQENKIRIYYIERFIKNLLDKDHLTVETTLERLEELGLVKNFHEKLAEERKRYSDYDL